MGHLLELFRGNRDNLAFIIIKVEYMYVCIFVRLVSLRHMVLTGTEELNVPSCHTQP